MSLTEGKETGAKQSPFDLSLSKSFLISYFIFLIYNSS